jgi:23S rRNA pseudouridine2605 synthase
LIRAGRVALNGRTCRNPEAPVRVEKDQIAVDQQLVGESAKQYIMLNKPRGLITTRHDEKGRPTVLDRLPEDMKRLSPVGRLDKASEGLLLFTNDSEWAARILDPKTHLEKTYHVQIGTRASDGPVRNVLQGVRTKSGELLQVKSAHILRGGSKNTWLEIVLDEGKNRQIRRIFESLGIEVLRLVRVAIGPLHLGNLKKGESRELLAEEKGMIDHAFTFRGIKP